MEEFRALATIEPLEGKGQALLNGLDLRQCTAAVDALTLGGALYDALLPVVLEDLAVSGALEIYGDFQYWNTRWRNTAGHCGETR